MFKRRSTITLVMTTFCALLFFIVKASADDDARQLEGSWFGTVTVANPPLGSFNDLVTFTENGEVIESRRLYVPESPFGPMLETPGHGEWVKTGPHEFQINFVFLLEGAPDNASARGADIGTDNISIRVRVAHGELQGSFESNIKDPNGNVIFTATGPYTAAPIHATQ
jgi:hypothetical protein